MVKVIVISGQPGSGSTSAAKSLAKNFSLNYFTLGHVWKSLGLGNLQDQFYFKEFKELCDSKNITLPDLKSSNGSEAVENVWNSIGKNKEFNEALDELQIRLAERGNIVAEGKLAINMIKKADIKIWFKADIKKRIERIAFRDKISIDESAARMARRQERERIEWKKIYGFDYFDQEHAADIVIDTSNMTKKEIVENVLTYINNKL